MSPTSSSADREKKLGIETVPGAPVAWDKNTTSYDAIASKVKSSGADAIFLGGIVCNNGGKLIKDLRGQAPVQDVQILGPDGWTPISATIEGAGEASEGMYITQPGIPADQLKGEGKAFVDEFTAENGKAPNPYTAYAAQAAVGPARLDRRLRRDSRFCRGGALQPGYHERDPR